MQEGVGVLRLPGSRFGRYEGSFSHPTRVSPRLGVCKVLQGLRGSGGASGEVEGAEMQVWGCW